MIISYKRRETDTLECWFGYNFNLINSQWEILTPAKAHHLALNKTPVSHATIVCQDQNTYLLSKATDTK